MYGFDIFSCSKCIAKSNPVAMQIKCRPNSEAYTKPSSKLILGIQMERKRRCELSLNACYEQQCKGDGN